MVVRLAGERVGRPGVDCVLVEEVCGIVREGYQGHGDVQRGSEAEYDRDGVGL